MATAQKIRSVVVKTTSVPKELMKMAKKHDVKVDTLDFNILEIKTFSRINDGRQESEWEYALPDHFYELKDEVFLNPEFQIKQVYEIEIYSKSEDEDYDDPYKDLKLAMGANSTKSKIFMTFQAGSRLEYNARLKDELIALINKRKIRSGILVNVFDEMLEGTIEQIAEKVENAKVYKFEKNETILIAESYEPILITDDQIIFHYKKDEEKEIDENAKIDYASRDFIQNVKREELIIERIKGKEPKVGRDCRGVFIKPPEKKESQLKEFAIDETIKQIEDEDSIKYYADRNGYVAFENNVYKIKTDVEVKDISFKSTGTINAGVDSDVTINVQEKDAVKDAIGNGMTVEVSEININGNVGSNATVYAIKANIEGQTHDTSVIRADKVSINVHKGTAYGKNIRIERLEHGTVECDVAEIVQAAGGNIFAKEITIDLCGSNVKATASKVIEIKKLHGSENFFTINPMIKRSDKKDLDKNKREIEELERDIRKAKKDIEQYAQLLKEGATAFKDIKRRLAGYKKNGVKMPESFLKKVKQFQHLQESYEQAKKDYSEKTDKYTLLTTKTASFQDNILDAKIINRSRWVGYNELKFVLVDPPMEIVYKPKEGSTDQVFALVEVDEGEYEIQAVKE